MKKISSFLHNSKIYCSHCSLCEENTHTHIIPPVTFKLVAEFDMDLEDLDIPFSNRFEVD